MGEEMTCSPAKVRAIEGLRWEQSLVQQNLIYPPQTFSLAIYSKFTFL